MGRKRPREDGDYFAYYYNRYVLETRTVKIAVKTGRQASKVEHMTHKLSFTTAMRVLGKKARSGLCYYSRRKRDYSST